MIFKKNNAYAKVKVGRYVPFDDAPQHSDSFRLFIGGNERIVHKWVHYFEIYDRYFARYKNTPVNILEIGVFKGGSLKLWKNYFGNRARIFGVDVDPGCKQYEEENIRVFIGDQSDRTFLRGLVAQLPKLDIVIDDGGHMSKQQIISFEEIYPHIAEDGVYLVEDTLTNYWKRYNKGTKISFVDYARKLVDELHAWHFKRSIRSRYALPYKERKGSVPVKDFTRQTRSIHFYNSVVVFEKQPTPEPYHCYSN